MTPGRLMLTAAQAAAVDRGARAARPREYCAALLGRTTARATVVTDVVRLRSCDTRPGRFALSDAEVRRARLAAHERGHELVALVHSHATGPPVPSDRDLRSLAYSRYPWVIAGFDRHDELEIAAFRPGTGAAVPVRVVD